MINTRNIITGIICMVFSWSHVQSQNTSISDVPHQPASSAVLDVYSTSKGFLVPRVLQSERIAISSPVKGLMVYQTNGTEGFYYYNGIAWTLLASGTGSQWQNNTNDIYFNAGKIGIGVTQPNSELQVAGSFSLPVITKSVNYLATLSDYTILCNVSTMTVSLPDASIAHGRIYVIKRISQGHGTITIDPFSNQTIDGASVNTFITSPNQSVTIQSDGNNWQIITRF